MQKCCFYRDNNRAPSCGFDFYRKSTTTEEIIGIVQLLIGASDSKCLSDWPAT